MAQRKGTRAEARARDTVEGGRDRASLPRPTATAARRRRPTSKALDAQPTERKTRGSARKTAVRGRAAAKPSARREDKRESPTEYVSDAEPKNLNAADTNEKKNKGKATHELEAQAPGKRPSRKSSRGGANHIKPDAQQRRQVTRAVRSPKNRHSMRST